MSTDTPTDRQIAYAERLREFLQYAANEDFASYRKLQTQSVRSLQREASLRGKRAVVWGIDVTDWQTGRESDVRLMDMRIEQIRALLAADFTTMTRAEMSAWIDQAKGK